VMKRQRRIVGMIVRIPFSSTKDAFAQVLAAPEIAVLDLFKTTGMTPSAEEISSANLLFRIWVMNRALTDGHWERICIVPLRTEFTQRVARFKRDPISGLFSIYVGGVERPAAPCECIGLEPAAVWSAEHVEARLKDHVGKRTHRPLDALREGIPKR
jgi:Immunity protein 26